MNKILTVFLLLSSLAFAQDYPAVKHEWILCTEHGYATNYCMSGAIETVWLCEDQKMSLQTSVDGSEHWCHKPQYEGAKVAWPGTIVLNQDPVWTITAPFIYVLPSNPHCWIEDWDKETTKWTILH